MKISSAEAPNAHAASWWGSSRCKSTGLEAQGRRRILSPSTAPIDGISRTTTNTPVSSSSTPHLSFALGSRGGVGQPTKEER